MALVAENYVIWASQPTQSIFLLDRFASAGTSRFFRATLSRHLVFATTFPFGCLRRGLLRRPRRPRRPRCLRCLRSCSPPLRRLRHPCELPARKVGRCTHTRTHTVRARQTHASERAGICAPECSARAVLSTRYPHRSTARVLTRARVVGRPTTRARA